MKFEAQYAIAQVDQACALIRAQFLALRFQVGQRDGIGVSRKRPVRLRAQVVVTDLATVLILIERRVAAGQHLLDPRRDGGTVIFYALHGSGHAERIPDFKRAQLPLEAPLHGVINLEKLIRDFGHAPRGIRHAERERMPQELAGAVLGIDEHFQALAQWFDVFGLANRFKAHFGGRLVFERVQVECPELARSLRHAAFALHLLVETLARLVADPVALQQFCVQRTRAFMLQQVARLVACHQVIQVVADRLCDVQADQVQQAERGRLRIADERAC